MNKNEAQFLDSKWFKMPIKGPLIYTIQHSQLEQKQEHIQSIATSELT